MSVRHNFSSRLSLYVLLMAAGAMLVVILLLGYFSSAAVRSASLRMAEKDLDLTILEIEQLITEVERAVDNLDWVVAENLDDEPFLYDVTREIVEANPNVIGSAIAFEPGFYKGRPFFAPYSFVGDLSHETHTFQMGNENYDYPILDWYLIPKLLGRPYWSDPYYDDGGGGQRMATYSMPLVDDDGRFYGVMTADISLEWLTSRVEALRPYDHSYGMLISHNGSFIAHPDSSKVLNETIFTSAFLMNDPMAVEVGKAMLAGKRGTQRIRSDDQDSFVVYGPLSNGWSLGMISYYSDVFLRVRILNIVVILLLLLGLLSLYLGCRKIIRQLTMPIVEFTNASMTIAKGNFKVQIPEVKSKDELLRLRNSLDYMQHSINDYIAELKTTTASNERYESELNIAREIQLGMLPTDFPRRDDVSLHAMVQPAKEVGGDLYDFIEKGDTLYFLVGDVSGKGVPAALFMSIARAAFRFIGALGLPMDEVMRRVNNCLCDGNHNDMFVTIFAARLDLRTGEMDYCNAGHNPIVVVAPDGTPEYLHAQPNLAAGLFEDFPYQAEKLQLAHGTRLVLYTDGVTEAERADKSQFGEERLSDWARGLRPDAASDAAVIDLYTAVKRFTAGADQNDDITILSLLWK